MSEDVTTGVTWSDIYESPQVDRSLRRLPRLCREAVRLVWAAGRRELLVVLAIKAVNGLGLAAVLLLGEGLLDGGRVVESGSHDQLMGLGGRYADLFTLQASAYLSTEPS